MKHITIDSYKAASAKLAAALSTKRSGFVTRVAVSAEQAQFASETAWLRRVSAKLALQRGSRDYSRASMVPDMPAEIARLCTDRRAMLSELVVGDLLLLTGHKTSLQPLVSHSPEPGADVSFDGQAFEIKSAGQLASEWHGCKSYGRLTDDERLMINCNHHSGYLKEKAFGGYLCAYLYVENDQPAGMDLFFFTADSVSKARRNAGRIGAGGGAMDYYSLSLPFADTRYKDGCTKRITKILAGTDDI